MVELLVVERSLPRQFRKVHARSELGRIEIEFQRSQHTLVLVHWIVAGIAGQVGRPRRKAYVPVSQRHEVRNENTCHFYLAESILKEEDVVPATVDRALQLETSLLLLGREDGILFIALHQYRGRSLPRGPSEVWIDVVD